MPNRSFLIMNRSFLAVGLVFLKFALTSLLSMPLNLFDPLLAAVVIYTFFHSLDTKDFVTYALFCGFAADLFSLNSFGTYMFSYLACAFSVSLLSRIVYRQNWLFVFPLVFLGVFLNAHFILILEPILSRGASPHYGGLFLLRTLAESFGTTLLAYPLYLFSKRCASQLIA